MTHDKKLAVLFRLEPGCLGPTGVDYIEAFCEHFKSLPQLTDFATISLVPRYDKSLPEWEYRITGKRINGNQLTSYLAIFESSPEQFEDAFETLLAEQIDEFFSRT